SSSSSSWLGSRGGHVSSVMATRLQSTNQVRTFSGMRGVMSAPVWMLRRSPPTQRELRHRQSRRRHYDARYLAVSNLRSNSRARRQESLSSVCVGGRAISAYLSRYLALAGSQKLSG